MYLSNDFKRKCITAKTNGVPAREIYNNFYKPHYAGMSFETFARKLRLWKSKFETDQNIIDGANLGYGFVPHGSTVQVDKNGNIVQAWVKQHKNNFDKDAVIEYISTLPRFEKIEISGVSATNEMLEIPLFDMHFGITDYEYYLETLNNIINIIKSKKYNTIFIPIGQDLFHNNDMRGHTANGTDIEAVNIPVAFMNARDFYFNIITSAIEHSENVYCSYTIGNHDETLAWAFFQLLKQVFGEQARFDDTIKPRKVFSWENIFVGYGHADKGKNSAQDIRCQFTIEYPQQFANAKIREIHLGHLHHERTSKDDIDEYGVMVRRLCTGNYTDNWHNQQGYIGAHKRFMLFGYTPNKLCAIYYV